MSNILPKALRLIAATLTQIADLIEGSLLQQQQQHQPPADIESGRYTPNSTTTLTINYGPCNYCARSRVSHEIPFCFYHLDRKTKRELYPDL